VNRSKMATSDSKAPLRTVKRVQFGILSPDEIVSGSHDSRNPQEGAFRNYMAQLSATREIEYANTASSTTFLPKHS